MENIFVTGMTIENPIEDVVETENETETAVKVEAETETTVIGVICECERLNVREKSNGNAKILTVLPVGTEVLVDINRSTENFYKVCTAAGIEGFCMKEYIDLQK